MRRGRSRIKVALSLFVRRQRQAAAVRKPPFGRVCRALLLAVGLQLALRDGAAAAEPAGRFEDLAATAFENFGRDQGLPHPVPTALAQDGDGFLWVGTQGGLARWDGYRFRGYKYVPGDRDTLPDGFIQTLHIDPAGRLWIGTSAGGLARYDREHDRIVAVPLGPAGNGRVHIGALADDGAGGLWIGTDDGLDRLDPETGSVSQLRHDGTGAAGLPANKVQALLRDRAGRLWVGTTGGLVRRDSADGDFVPIPLAPDAATIVGVTALFEDEAGHIWIGTTKHGAFLIAPPDGAARPVVETGPADALFAHERISAICQAGAHEIWIATRLAGIVAVDTLTGRTRRIRHDRTLSNSLAHDDIWALLRDRAGSIWAGGTGGLSYHPRDLGVVSTVMAASEQANGITGPDVYALKAASDGRLWLGFFDNGVDILDPVAGRVAQLRPDPARPATALPIDVVMAFAQAGPDMFIGTRRGLYRADLGGSRVAVQAVPGRDPYGSITSLLVDRGVLWVGGTDDGLWGVSLDDGALRFGPERSRGLGDQSINTIVRGRGNDLWIGTHNGVERLDLESGAIEHVPADPADPAAIPARFVSSLAVDRQGRLWVATFGGGIAVMTGRDAGGRPRFRRLGTADGLPHNNVDTVLVDGQGMIWAGTDEGLAQIDPASLAIRALRNAEGSPLLDFFTNAGTVDADGEALFGAKGGIAVVRPRPLEPWSFRAPVVVTDIRVGGRAVPSSRFNGPGSGAPLQLTADTNSLAVEFAALDFSAPQRNRYAYRLEGFDADWTQTDATRRLAAYTNLPPGHYVLRLRGSNRDGLWTERELALPVDVLPAWYQTLWFRLALALAGLAATAMIIRSRTAYLRRRQAVLERQVADRTADLRAANERLFELATTDPLTGCMNRRHFTERADDLLALAGRYRSPVSLIVIDLDRFKWVNDTYGHPAGDEVLRLTGLACREHVRATDLLARMGGEEFALLMPHTGAEGAAQLADRLREAIRGIVARVDGAVVQVTASLGLAELRPGEDFDKLYARADAALYAAKERGRNCTVVFEEAV